MTIKDDKVQPEEDLKTDDRAPSLEQPASLFKPISDPSLRPSKSKTIEDIAEEKRKARQHKTQLSEEFNTNPLKKQLVAAETGDALRKLFINGELTESWPNNKYTDSEKEDTKRKMEELAARILKHSNSSPALVQLQPETRTEQPVIEATDSIEQPPLAKSISMIRKKKPWEK